MPVVSTRSTVSEKRPLDDLATVQMLEETIGPRSLRNLAAAVATDAERRLLESLARNAADDRHELDEVIHAWRRAAAGMPERETPHVADAPDVRDVVESLVEVKESEAGVLRRAAREAPNERLRERLLGLAARAEATAEKLRSLA